MYDAWSAYDDLASPYLLGNTIGDYSAEFVGVPSPENVEEARKEAISYAAYRLLTHRFVFSPGADVSLPAFEQTMIDLGYDINFDGTDYTSGNPAELGNYIAEQYIAFGLQDGSNEIGEYSNLYYVPLNLPIDMTQVGNPNMTEPNHWQPLELPLFIDQAGNPFTEAPAFQSPEWGNVIPFALTDDDKTTYTRDGDTYHVYLDPGPPALIDTLGPRENDDIYRWGFSLVSIWQSHLDPDDGVMWDISPASIGNHTEYPTDYSEYPDFYDTFNGGDNSPGHPVNPKTGLPYEAQIVPRADYARILAEFWADGPDSETPPGHWYTILNTVHDHPEFERRWEGEGPELDDLEWDVKAYFTLGGSVHDAAVAAWSIKGWFDYVRPVSAIRYMADRGQNTDPDLPSYHPAGIPLVEGLVEIVNEGDALAGDEGEHVGKIKLYTWRGPDYIEDPEVDYAGVGWILAENWWPYQRPTFVTPPFAGFVSGHSTFSRAAAETLTRITGDPYFPGGMGEFDAPQGEFLVFEDGPSIDITLQWATYRDASDQCSLSRIWGGIHPPVDDIPGRFIGIEVGNRAFEHAQTYILAGYPRVASIDVQSEVINLGMVDGNFEITVTFDQAMNTNLQAELIFNQDNPENCLLNPQFEWLSDTQLQIVWEVENSMEVLNNIELAFGGLIGQNEWPLFEESFENLFRIDLIAPTTTNLLCPNLINRNAIGEDITLEVWFSKEMNPEALSGLAMNPEPLNLLLSENPENRTWITPNRLQLNFTVNDFSLETENIALTLAGMLDHSGNPLPENALPGGCMVDTQSPIALSMDSSEENLTPADSGEEVLSLTVNFSEDMNESSTPNLFLSGTQNALNFNANASGWTSAQSYEAVYDLSDSFTESSSISLGVSGAEDLAGNPIAPTNFPNLFTLNGDTGLEGWEDARMFLSPNPWQAGQALELQDYPKGAKEWQLYDAMGRLVSSGSLHPAGRQRIDPHLGALNSGVYLLHVVESEKHAILRLIVTKK